jgi:hypothetical protein
VHLGLHFATSAGGFPNYIQSGLTAWLTDQRFSLPGDVAPGQTVSVTVSPTAPATARSVLLEAEMVKEGQFWFDQWQSSTVRVTPAVWAADYDLTAMPRNWAPYQVQAFPVKVVNTGNQTWRAGGATPVHLGVHFASAIGGYPNNATWLTDQRTALPNDLAPGGRATLMVTAQAPLNPGAVLEAEMVLETRFWFSDWAPLKTMGGSPTWNANYDMSAAPRTWTAGQSQTFAITVTNTGNMVWPAGGSNPVHLGLHFATAPGGYPAYGAWLTDQRVSLVADLPPGASVSVMVTATAPASATPAVLEVEAVKEYQFWFKEWSTVSVTSTTAVWTAGYDLTQAPRTWAPGQTQTFTVILVNQGNQTWPAGGTSPVHLGLHFATTDGGWPAQNKPGMTAWVSDQRIALPNDLAPGGSAPVTVTATAPGGSYNTLEAEMVKEQAFWFTDWAPVTLIPGPVIWSADYDISGAPRTWAPGRTQSFQVTVVNTGNLLWPSGGASPMRLGLHFANGEGGWTNFSGWATDQRFSLPADVPPGGRASLTVSVTAPAGAVPLVLEAELVQDQSVWMNAWSALATGS